MSMYGCARRAPIKITIEAPAGSGKEAVWTAIEEAIEAHNDMSSIQNGEHLTLRRMQNEGFGKEVGVISRKGVVYDPR